MHISKCADWWRYVWHTVCSRIQHPSPGCVLSSRDETLWGLNSSLLRIPPSVMSTSRCPVSGSLALVSPVGGGLWPQPWVCHSTGPSVFASCPKMLSLLLLFRGRILSCHIPSLVYAFISMNIWVFLYPGHKNNSASDGHWCAGLIFVSPFHVCSGAEQLGENTQVSLHTTVDVIAVREGVTFLLSWTFAAAGGRASAVIFGVDRRLDFVIFNA